MTDEEESLLFRAIVAMFISYNDGMGDAYGFAGDLDDMFKAYGLEGHVGSEAWSMFVQD